MNLLIVVDFQNDFVDGSLGFQDAKKLEDKIEEKIHIYEKNKDDIIFTLDTHDTNYLQSIEGKNLPIKHCIKDTFGWQIYGKIQNLSKNYKKIQKNTFGSSDLLEYLKNLNFTYDKIELVGLVSNICVISNAIIAKTASPKSEILVDKNATSSYDLNMQEKTFDILENLHIKVINR